MEQDGERRLAWGVLLEAVRQYWMLTKKEAGPKERVARREVVAFLRSRTVWHGLAGVQPEVIEGLIRRIRHGEVAADAFDGRICKVMGCTRMARRRGMCYLHAARADHAKGGKRAAG